MEARRLGKYELVTHLASGGMASVYLARLTGLGGFQRHVVLKMLEASQITDEQLISMFLDEARLVAQLHHQHIAQVYEVGCEDGTYFLVMEYVHGETVRHVLEAMRERGRRLPLDFCLTILCAAAAGLHHAHERRAADGSPLDIVHRDVTPSNVIACYDGSVKLIDFGIAKAAARSTVTASGLIKGKVGYMAPEQVRGYKVDRRSDVFALGVLAYELTTQTRAFGGDNQFEQLEKTARGDIVPPSQVVTNYPPSLERLVLRALEVDPDDRFPSALAMRVALTQVASELGLVPGETPVMRTLAELFGYRPEPWVQDARAHKRRPTTHASLVTPPVALVDRALVDRVKLARGTKDLERMSLMALQETVDASQADDDNDDIETDPIELVDLGLGNRELVQVDRSSQRAITVMATDSPSERASTVSLGDETQPQPMPPILAISPPPLPRGMRAKSVKPPPLPLGSPRRSTRGSSPPPPPPFMPPRTITPSVVVDTGYVPPPIHTPLVVVPDGQPTRTLGSVSTSLPSAPYAPSLPEPPIARTLTKPPPSPRWRAGVVGGSIVLAMGVAAALLVVFSVDSSTPTPPTAPAASVVESPPSPSPSPPAPTPTAPAPAPEAEPRQLTPPHEPDALPVPRVVESTPEIDPPAVETKLEPVTPAHVAVVVTTDPPDATVLLDGVRLGRTPYTGEFPTKQGEVWLKIRKQGYRAIKQKVSLASKVSWDVKLQASRR